MSTLRFTKPYENKDIVITLSDIFEDIFVRLFHLYFARFLCDVLSSLVPYNHSCKDTFSFVFQIKNANLSKKFLVSYDVTSLFTNISLQETIDIAINLILNHNPNLNITRKEL